MADEHADVRTAFAGLSVRDRELLWMREVAGLPYTDVAGRFSLKQGAARIAVMRAANDSPRPSPSWRTPGLNSRSDSESSR